MHRLLRLTPQSALAIAAIALAGCRSSNDISTVPSLGGGHGRQSASSGTLAAARAAVACARRHGMPSVPDPTLGANGQVTFAGGAPTPTPEVQSACAAQIRAAQAASSTLPTLSASDMQALLTWAACMRANGLPRWPDPNSQGEFHVKEADAGNLTTYPAGGKGVPAAARLVAGPRDRDAKRLLTGVLPASSNTRLGSVLMIASSRSTTSGSNTWRHDRRQRKRLRTRLATMLRFIKSH